jgi:predicted transcriptional regulator
LVEAMHLAGREVSTAAVNFHAVVAAKRGLARTDTKALDLLLREGPLTHGELGDRIGLAPASVTGLVDRLEKKGLVHRKTNPQDRRSILIGADAAIAYATMAPLFTAWVGELEELYDRYSDGELEVIADFMHRAAERQEAITAEIAKDTSL